MRMLDVPRMQASKWLFFFPLTSRHSLLASAVQPTPRPPARRRSWSTVFPSTAVFGRPHRAAVSLVDVLVRTCRLTPAGIRVVPVLAGIGSRPPPSLAFAVQKPWIGTERTSGWNKPRRSRISSVPAVVFPNKPAMFMPRQFFAALSLQ
jgi:hypothetical protein